MPNVYTHIAVNSGIHPFAALGIAGGGPSITSGLLQEDGTDFFELESGTGIILLES